MPTRYGFKTQPLFMKGPDGEWIDIAIGNMQEVTINDVTLSDEEPKYKLPFETELSFTLSCKPINSKNFIRVIYGCGNKRLFRQAIRREEKYRRMELKYGVTIPNKTELACMETLTMRYGQQMT